ncbi:MAG: hypothetical protein QMD08_08365 [Actinomycetota bacterium]|nr:hypothetical protein [Actinomycetota bacterium]
MHGDVKTPGVWGVGCGDIQGCVGYRKGRGAMQPGDIGWGSRDVWGIGKDAGASVDRDWREWERRWGGSRVERWSGVGEALRQVMRSRGDQWGADEGEKALGRETVGRRDGEE